MLGIHHFCGHFFLGVYLERRVDEQRGDTFYKLFGFFHIFMRLDD